MPKRRVGDYSLTPKQQEAYDIWRNEGLSQKAIGLRLGVSAATIQQRLERVRLLVEGQQITGQGVSLPAPSRRPIG